MTNKRESDASGIPRHGVRTLAVFFLLSTVAFLDRSTVTLLVEPIKADLQINDFQFSLLTGLGFAGFYILLTLPIGWLIDRVSRRWILFCGVVVWSIATALGGMASTFWQLLLSRMFVGAGEGTLTPTVYSMLGDIFPRHQLARAVAIYATGVSVGSGLAYFLGGGLAQMVAQSGDVSLPIVGSLRLWQLVLLVSGLVGMVVAPLIFLLPDTRAARKGSAPASDEVIGGVPLVAFIKAHRRLLSCLFLGFALHYMIGVTIHLWAPAFIGRTYGWSIGQIGLTMGVLNGVCSTIGLFLTARYIDSQIRRGRHDVHFRFYIFATIAMVVAGSAAVLLPSPYAYLAGTAICFGLMPSLGMGGMAVQLITPSHLRGRITALYVFTCNLLGAAIGPSITGIMIDYVYHDPSKVGLAIATTLVLLGPLGTVALWLGMKPMRECSKKLAL